MSSMKDTLYQVITMELEYVSMPLLLKSLVCSKLLKSKPKYKIFLNSKWLLTASVFSKNTILKKYTLDSGPKV